jgi:hypothetical protein
MKELDLRISAQFVCNCGGFVMIDGRYSIETCSDCGERYQLSGEVIILADYGREDR